MSATGPGGPLEGFPSSPPVTPAAPTAGSMAAGGAGSSVAEGATDHPGRDTAPVRRRRRAPVGGDDGSERGGGRSTKATGQRWTRWLHVYTSMISLLLVLFFGITGITLNHPEWTFGDDPTTTTRTGTFSFDPAPGGSVDFLAISERLRSQYGITAPVTDHRSDNGQATIGYRSPGYAADVTVELTSRRYTVVIEEQGFVAVMNDLHKGRDTDRSWHWVIDVSAGFLVLISLSGLLLQLLLRRRRRSALIVAGAGLVLGAVLAALTL